MQNNINVEFKTKTHKLWITNEGHIIHTTKSVRPSPKMKSMEPSM